MLSRQVNVLGSDNVTVLCDWHLRCLAVSCLLSESSAAACTCRPRQPRDAKRNSGDLHPRKLMSISLSIRSRKIANLHIISTICCPQKVGGQNTLRPPLQKWGICPPVHPMIDAHVVASTGNSLHGAVSINATTTKASASTRTRPTSETRRLLLQIDRSLHDAWRFVILGR